MLLKAKLAISAANKAAARTHLSRTTILLLQSEDLW